MFFGRYEHSLDEKNRIVIPKRMREEVSSPLYIMKGYDGALSLYSAEAFNNLITEINSLPFQKKESRSYIRTQLSSTYELEVDKLGRVTIPTALITRYGIGKDIFILGVVDHIEIWDRTKYLEYEKEADSSYEEVAGELIDHGE
ncbi:MAG: division/cell wall cluster transcriptional repressor MraZ [Coprobacillus sp.]|nr:division/cell wall cluster transcriptional repressor MraZ [Coprobacillus sp.]